MFSQSVFFSCCSVCNIHNHDCYSVWHFHLEMVTQGILWYGRNQTSTKKRQQQSKTQNNHKQTNKTTHKMEKKIQKKSICLGFSARRTSKDANLIG